MGVRRTFHVTCFHDIDKIDKSTKWAEKEQRIWEVGFPEIRQIDKIYQTE